MKDGIFRKAIDFLSKKKALTTLVGVVASMSMIITASLAWFTLNRQTAADEMGMGLKADDTQAVYKVYMYDLSTGEGTDKADGVDLNIANLDLNQYDTIFRVYNKYTPAFAKIELTRTSSMHENGTIFITINKNKADGTTEFPSAYSSSILRFTAFIYTDKSDRNHTTPDALYNFVNNGKFSDVEKYLNNDNVDRPFSKTFVSNDEADGKHIHEKAQSITIEVPYTASAWHPNGDGTEVLNVYLYMTYDEALVECYMNERTDGETNLGDNTVFFKNDLKDVRVSYANAGE